MPQPRSSANARHDWAWRGLALPAAASAACFLLILLAGQLAVYVPAAWQGAWAGHIVANQPYFLDRFFPFDAVWYQRIADTGYVWDPAQPTLKQDDAFFPLWPLLLRLVSASVPAHAVRGTVVVLAAGFAVASVSAFGVLARRVLPAQDARTATLLFAFYPAASFLLLSYPTGLMNLLCILALLALMDEQFAAAAACAGLVTAIGPLGLGTALTVSTLVALRAWQDRGGASLPAWRTVLPVLATCLLSVSGLALFMLWQLFSLDDAFAFVKAQQAWAMPLPWLQRVPRAAMQILIVPDFAAALWELRHAARAATLMALQASVETCLNLAAQGVALVALIASSRLVCLPVLLQGVFTMALFIWFHSTSRPGNSTLRLTYCIMGMFLGAAWLLRGRPRLAAGAVAASASLMAGAAFLTAAGYHVV
jgi:hypothetical protein